ncbi:sensor histidine kinase [Nonomuraea sp. SYSU D8015]|uniref:sensor histidine kinase n=1 Tax=Nonomuraea sp. SYSU D8015 TaxID=2593644 RepID=UPI0016604B65|nr:sensor histidine kinase [Nonomuraea sp. SYSU D8015]
MIAAWRKLPALARDTVWAVLATLVVLGVPLLSAPSGLHTPLWAALVCAVCAPLAVRRRLPMTAALASGAAVVLAQVLHQPGAGTWVAVGAFMSAAYHAERHRWLPMAAATGWLVGLEVVSFGLPPDPFGLVTPVAAGLAPMALGHILRLRHDEVRQAELVQRAQERAQLAREVHDVVGHHLSAIRLQAVGARRGTPADAQKALDLIAEISGTALGETRRLLGLLRDQEDMDTDLGSLLAGLSRQGLRVRLDGDPLRDEVPSRVRYAVYRIVQESLTNVMRHSGASRAVVRIRRRPRLVEATVEDNGRAVPGGPEAPKGGGLRGMRERAALLGGTLTAGPREPSGWRVTARFPLDENGAER